MKRRLIVIAITMFALFSALIAHYFTLQIAQHPIWSGRAAAQHELIVKEPCKRGTFFASMSKQPGHVVEDLPLAIDITKYHLYIDPLAIPPQYRPMIIEKLTHAIALSPSAALEFEKSSHSRCVMRWLTGAQKTVVSEWWFPFARSKKIPSNALYFVTDYQRSYPYGALLGQTLHTIQEFKDEKTDQALPTGGLESYFNSLLQGKPGKRKLLRSPRNRLEIDQLVTPPEDGADIYLTINPYIQAIAEQELARGVNEAQAKGGWVIIMEAMTGHIIALAQHPPFDPANYKSYYNDPDKIESAKVHPVTDAFELGSIMKPVTVAIALQANRALQKEGKPPLFDPADKMSVTRTQFPGRVSKPLRDLPSHRALNMAMAIQKSSNIYMAELADRIVNQLGITWYRNQLIETFGFENKTHIELPAEAIGLVPSKQRHHANGTPEWSLPTPYSLSIGYNLLANSIQMLRAYAVFANGGYLVTPTLVKKIVKGEHILLDHTIMTTTQVMEQEDAYKVLEAMKYTTKFGGTGRLAKIAGYTEAGKTGSAEKIVEGKYAKKVHLSSFIGIVPARARCNHCLVTLVTIDEPAAIIGETGVKNYLGGRCAAPIFQRVMTKTMEVLGIPADDPYSYPKTHPKYQPGIADWEGEVKELKRLYDEWNVR